MMHVRNYEFLNHDRGEGLERKEWIQEIFNKTEQNLIRESLFYHVFEQDQLHRQEPSTRNVHRAETIVRSPAAITYRQRKKSPPCYNVRSTWRSHNPKISRPPTA